MAKEQKAKQGRTPEQQAARDARKAAKTAAAAAAEASTTTEPTDQAESSKSAQEASTGETRGREQEDDGTLLEIDVKAPEPLSKAELRAARKRAKLGLPELAPKVTKTDKSKRKDFDDTRDLQGEDSDGGDGANGQEKKEVKPERQNSIWIGNLSFRTTVESLQAFLEKGLAELGVDNTKGVITRVKMPKKGGGKGEFAANKGFAYVDFATPELQKLAVGLSESFVEGRKLLIKLGNDYVANPDARTPKPERAKVDPSTAWILKKQIHPESATLFVGNLPFDATEEALRDFIEENAAAAAGPAKKAEVKEEEEEEEEKDEEDDEEEEKGDGKEEDKAFNGIIPGRGGKLAGLRKVRLGAFEDTGRCKGFAFLDFLTPADATKTLVNRRNHSFGGRRLNVQYASESATNRSGGNRDKERPKGASGPRGPRTGAGVGAGVGAGFKRPREEPEENVDVEAEVGGAEVSEEWSEPPRKKDQRGKRWEATGRPRPGAALAMAKREKVGIVEGQGAKIVFD